MLDQLAQNVEWFQARGVRMAAVTMGKPYEAKMFCETRSPAVVCLSNPDQSAYQAYGIGRINLQDFLNPGSWRAWLRVMGQGFKPGPAGEQDALQLGATFIVDMNGRIVMAHYNRYMGDNPEIEKLKEVMNSKLVVGKLVNW